MKFKNRHIAKRMKRKVKGRVASGGDKTKFVKKMVERVMK